MWGAKSASQDIAEWKTCRDIVSSRWENLLWLDIRGNYDNLDVLSRNHSYNYFAMFSVMGLKGHLGSYVESLQTRGQKFNFIAVDATWKVGMNYPFIFVGFIDSK